MNKNGLEIKAVCVDTEKESSTATDDTTTTVTKLSSHTVQ